MPLLVPTTPPLAILLEFVSEVAGALLVLTGLVASSFRAWAVLTGQSAERVEWLTAFGFVVGAMIAIPIVIIALSLELN